MAPAVGRGGVEHRSDGYARVDFGADSTRDLRGHERVAPSAKKSSSRLGLSTPSTSPNTSATTCSACVAVAGTL